MKTRFAIAMLVPLFAIVVHPRSAQAADNYKIDPEHAAVIFKVDHLGVAPAYGRFNDPTGTIVLDKGDPSRSTFTFEVKTENVDTDNPKRDAHLKSPDFFDAKQFPTITFKSKSVKVDGEKYTVSGDLTLHGVTKQIVVPLVKTGEKDTGRMGYRTGWVAEVDLKRSDYGMTGMMGPIGDDVHLTISFEAVKS
ncbi:MAG TPA: YceI family protein [Tepidisphaeraceae bacterium]|nr:YceI family protein [Tepidisphaeraceae bacterium]